MNHTPYDPGSLPTRPPPDPGDIIEFEVTGYPPYKHESFSIRNPKHKHYSRFVELRKAASAAMGGRAWSHAPIRMNFTLHAQAFEKGRTLVDYAGGITDALDGSSGCAFTYLPVVFEDDCQICVGHNCIVPSRETKYHLRFEILEDVQQRRQPEAE